MDDLCLRWACRMYLTAKICVILLAPELLWEFNQHGGQIGYLRGEQRGLEDTGYSGGLLESHAQKSS